MRNTWAIWAAPLLAAAMATSCSQHADEKPAADPRSDLGGTMNQIIGLKGCVEGAADPNEYVLRNVQLEPLSAQPTDAATSVGVSVTEGSSVRLRLADSDELKKNLGQVVSVTGIITDDGRNTIGTGGSPRDPGAPEPSTDASQAATSQSYPNKQAKEAGPIAQDSMANGTLPQMNVKKVRGTGERCTAQGNPGRSK
jgi:hypothetical protein